MVRPMLGDLDLEQVQLVETDEDQVVTHHPVPALDAGFLQRLGRRGARLRLTGVLTRPDTLASLTELRERFLAASPVPFVSDISTATLVEQVLVEEMEVRELAGRPARLEYAFTLREFTEAQPVTPEPVDIPPPTLPNVEDGALAVTVVVEGEPTFDYDRVTVVARATGDAVPPPAPRTLTDRIADNVWLEDPLPAGAYTVEARVTDAETLTGSASTRVVDGEVAQVRIVLRRGARIGTFFVIHFRFDNAFVEPCMRPVLRQVADYAAAHPDEKLLVVGHTDLVGSDAYNQSLSERRSRATYAFLTFGRDGAAAVDEWNELRRARPVGVLPSARDTWGTWEYQHILADLGYFRGNIGKDLDLTDAAVRRFQADNGLAVDGIVGDASWPVLIEAYLAQDALAFPEAQLLRNAADGCDEGPLRWLGCNEQDPVLNVDHAWRPNRRTELLFVKESALPCPVPRPVTLDLVPEGAGGGGWCLDDGTASAVCCFVTPHDETCAAAPPRWCRRPAEEGRFRVRGCVVRDDGTPVAGASYVLTAPDGEFLDGEERKTTNAARAGTPIAGRTRDDGTFAYERETGPGIYTFAIDGPFVARLEGQPLPDVRGNTVCARLDGPGDLVVVVTARDAASVSPAITAPDAVVVRKPATNPARQPVTLQVSGPFSGTGTLSRSDDRVRVFPAAAGGTELAFDGVDNVFTDAQLVAGHTVFAEGARASDAVGDVSLALALTVGGTPGLTATHAMTSVELTLDLHASRTSAAALPAALTPAAKVDPGRFVHVQDPGFHAGRAMLTVRPAQPRDFTGSLVLRPVDGRLRAFDAGHEVAAAGQTPVASPLVLPNADLPPTGRVFWVEATAVSGGLRDTGYQLGVDGLEPDGDRVAVTAVQFRNLNAEIPATPAQTPRLGNSPVPAHNFLVGAGPAAADFDEDYTVNRPLALLAGSVLPATPVRLTVEVAPAGVPVRWSVQRASGIPAASGGDDDPAVVALSPNPTPTLVPDPADALAATLLADGVGSFHVRPFVDGNGNGVFDHGVDREPNIVLNLVAASATLNVDSSVARNTNFTVTPVAGGGIRVRSGTFDIAAPATAAMHLNAQIDVVSGGADGRRAIDRLFAGWVNNETAPEDVVGTYTDSTAAPPRVHPSRSVFASNSADASGASASGAAFVPGDPAPAVVAPPLLDSGRGAPGTGGDSATLTTSRIRTRTDRPVGQRWLVEAVDSPGDGDDGTHPAVAAARLTAFRFGLTFGAFLAVWTNVTGASGPTGDAADRLYTVVRQVDWAMDGEWTVDPATGAITVVTAPTTTVTGTTTFTPAAAAQTTPAEPRPPTGLSLLARDAQA